MQEVQVVEKRLADYRAIIGPSATTELLALAGKIKGKRVAHISATPQGGGVSELLHSIVPLQRDVGLDAHWFTLSAPNVFFETTKALHNSLQGANLPLTPEMLSSYRNINEANASSFSDDFDYVVVHDPQPAPLVSMCEHKGNWIWRCHIDLTSPNPSVLAMMKPYIAAYDACIFSTEAYVPHGVSVRKAYIAAPAIDPLSNKNRHVYDEEREAILPRLGFDPDRPVLSQVGRFDPWKDPIGVIDAYRLVKADIPEVQLLLVSSMPRDDPEGWIWFEHTVRHAGEDPDIHFLTDLRGVGALEVNLIQRESDVALLKSRREGFGLTVSESLWKRVPVVGGRAGGIRIQIRDGRHGFLVDSVQETAMRAKELLQDEKRRRSMGKAGREHVRHHFLVTRYLRDHLRLMLDVRRNG